LLVFAIFDDIINHSVIIIYLEFLINIKKLIHYDYD